MIKKILSFFVTVCILCTVFPCAVFAIDESGEIDAARKAIRKSESTLTAYNDMPMEAFISLVKTVIPEGSSVKLSFEKESDYRIYNATSEKDGSIFANIQFDCGPYTRHDMYTIKIPALTGAAAENNQDAENVAKDIAEAREIFKSVSLDPNVTPDDILNSIRAVITHGSTVTLDGEFTKVDSTAKKKGSVKCFVKFTINSASDTLKVYNTLKLLGDNSGNIPATPAAPAGFTDVADDAYYADAVKWAVEKNITQGTSDTTFSPDETCTRAQILTFLWRAVGSPKTGDANPFADVTANDYYYDAAIWAAKMGMVSGDRFNGDTPCTRALTVTYLWKNDGAEEYEDLGVFDDIDANADYCAAVSWAVENGVTSGVSDTEFAPNEICSRGQIVTFLKRALG